MVTSTRRPASDDTGGDLECDLLVGRPLRVDVGELAEVLECLGRRRPWVAHADLGACLPGALRDSLVAG